MNKPKYQKGDRISGTLWTVVEVYQPDDEHDYLIYVLAYGTNKLTLLGCNLTRYFPTA